MKIITALEIRKFRSIKSITRDLNLTDLNVLVGQNDNGKSNILRALNLFFNNQTDAGQPFRFEEDYCYHADSGTGSRREVRIDLIIEPPKNRFKNAQTLRWTKQWKRDGSIVENRVYAKTGTEIQLKDNISKWLDKLKYRYVPAIKGKDYFNALMGELHDVLNEAHSSLMANQGKGFISGIQKVTNDITKELKSQIGISSTIQVPSDFKQLFSNLDFGSKEGENTYHLKQRGDGIKVRHIPVILKYMAEQEKNISIPGYVKPDTIWGFEEPENNLEMRFAFELAETLKIYSNQIQILLTTHSPAFYALSGDQSSEVSKFFVTKNQTSCTTVTSITGSNHDDMHEKMGMLPLITPYLEATYKAQEKIKELEQKISSISKTMKCCFITEDKNNSELKILLEANGFDLTTTELFSYDGKDQIKGALILAKYLKQKYPEMTVAVHRDRDYLSDEEISTLQTSFVKNGVGFFCTIGVDCESHFISVEHLKQLNLGLSIELLEDAITQATNEARTDSIDRFINHIFSTKKPIQSDYAGELRTINKKYDENTARYRYGKKVLGLLTNKLQTATRKNVKIRSITSALLNSDLRNIASHVK